MAISRQDAELQKAVQEFEAKTMFGQTVTTAGLGQGLDLFPQIYKAKYEFDITPNTMLYHASVEKIENGYILKITHRQGEQPKIYVAHNADELKDLFIAAIVSERISK